MQLLSNIFFRPPTVYALAEKELHDAHRSLLQAQAGLEWAQAMVTYHQTRINRLNAYLETQDDVKTDPSVPGDSSDPARGFPRWSIRGSY